jgi:hypothetical protein
MRCGVVRASERGRSAELAMRLHNLVSMVRGGLKCLNLQERPIVIYLMFKDFQCECAEISVVLLIIAASDGPVLCSFTMTQQSYNYHNP